MLGAKTPLKNAEKLKNYLIKNDLMREKYKVKKDDKNIVFPVKKDFSMKKVDLVEEDFAKMQKRKTWRQRLKEKLTEEEYDNLITAHDIVGSIAIIEIPEELEHREKDVAEALLKANKNIKTVLKKAGEHSGTFRTQDMEYVAGEKTKNAIHKENGVRLKVNVEDMYFSARLSTERKRISKKVKKGEFILIMFSGCAPYPCVFAKNTEAQETIGVEINPKAHDFGVENVHMNNLDETIDLVQGDVREVVPELNKKFDRICMPLPKSSEDFLDLALSASKKETIIHFYDFLHEDEFDEAERKVKEACEKAGFSYEVLELVKCGQYSPRKYRVCLDFKVK